ncbi:MAG TPA: bifunctional phosphoglucose/phosphomannose isomerase [Thermoplasmata archaeon]|nr:bifunctional phosphoglucose/phosphomannose isomerase [Thermoplasmata archaeon]
MLDEAAVRRIDRAGAREHIQSLSDQIVRGLQAGLAIGPIAAQRRAFVVGMGGSGIAGAVLAAWLAAERGVAVGSVNDSALPPWIDEGDLVIAVSYSGNTLETLAAAREARARGADLAGVASGGTLRDLCHGHGLPFLAVPPGLMPRSAFGYLFGGLAALFPDTAGPVRAAAEETRTKGAKLLPAVADAKNPAKRLATRLKGRTPVVYGTPTYAPVARRWQTEFNENAKVLAWASVLPEADHNELVGWAGDPAAKRFAPILLRDPEEAPDHKAMMDATRDLIKRKAKVEEVHAEGTTLLARMLATIQLGDWTSFYLAILRKVDPTPVAVIGKLKERLAKG